MISKLCQRFRRSSTKDHSYDHFKLYRREEYIFFGWGTLQATAAIEPQPITYYRLRPYLGRSDPCLLHQGLQQRSFLSRKLVKAEKREISRALWRSLFSLPPSHILRFGWKSQATGYCHDILYLPLNFRHSGYGSAGLARDFGGYLLNAIQHSDDLSRLCPASSDLLEAQIAWLTIAFIHYEWQLTHH